MNCKHSFEEYLEVEECLVHDPSCKRCVKCNEWVKQGNKIKKDNNYILCVGNLVTSNGRRELLTTL